MTCNNVLVKMIRFTGDHGFKKRIGSVSHGSGLVRLVELAKGWIDIGPGESTIEQIGWFFSNQTVQPF